MAYRRYNHPDAKPGEVVSTNVFHVGQFEDCSYETKRKSSCAFDINDQLVAGGYALLVQEAEVRERGVNLDA